MPCFFYLFLEEIFFFEAHTVPAGIFFFGIKRARGVVAITQGLKDEFIKRGVRADKILVAPDGVDLEEFKIKETKEECRRILGLTLGKTLVLYTGHLYSWKGTDTLLEAARNFQIFKFSKYIVFANGRYKRRYQKTVSCQLSVVKC